MHFVNISPIMRKLLLSLLAAATICPGATGRIDPAGRARLDSIIASHPGVTGVAMIAGDDTVTAGSTARLPLMSIFKLHIAIAALRSGLPIDSTVNMTTAQLRTDTYSPLRDSIGTAPARLTVDELMHYSVCRSDNNACDRLIELAGGIEKVDSIVRSLGITDFCLTRTEDEMHERISRSYDNVSTPLELWHSTARRSAPMRRTTCRDCWLGALPGATRFTAV